MYGVGRFITTRRPVIGRRVKRSEYTHTCILCSETFAWTQPIWVAEWRGQASSVWAGGLFNSAANWGQNFKLDRASILYDRWGYQKFVFFVACLLWVAREVPSSNRKQVVGSGVDNLVGWPLDFLSSEWFRNYSNKGVFLGFWTRSLRNLIGGVLFMMLLFLSETWREDYSGGEWGR